MTKSEQSTGLGVVGVAGEDALVERIAIDMHYADGDPCTVKWKNQSGKYRASLRRDVRDVLASMSRLGIFSPAPSMTPTTHPATGDVLEALVRLTKDAGEVSRLGAVTGRQWTLLAGSLILARAAISKAEALTLTTPEDQR